MKCQHCGNELGQDEVFCGQCGAPNAVPAQPTEMMQQAPTPSPRSGLLGSPYRSGAFPPNTSGQRSASENMPLPNQSALHQGAQMSGFYQDATESISSIPSTPGNFPPGSYPNQGMQSGGYNNTNQFGTQQAFPTNNFSNPSNATFPPTQMSYPTSQFSGGNYGTQSGASLPQPQKRGNVVIIVAIVCLVFAIVTIGIFGTLFALQGNNKPQSTPVAQATVAPTPTPTPSPTPMPTPTPTIAITPTPIPDANFSWCGDPCTQNGYQVEFPNGWTQGATQDGAGVQFTLTTQQDTYAAFKTPNSNAPSVNDLINADIQGLMTQVNPPTPPTTGATGTQIIGGASWNYQTITYQSPTNQVIQVTVYAIIRENKSYVIELASQQPTFQNVQTAYFNPMLGRFTFVNPA